VQKRFSLLMLAFVLVVRLSSSLAACGVCTDRGAQPPERRAREDLPSVGAMAANDRNVGHGVFRFACCSGSLAN
jgi:hypothetical protein